MRRGAPSSSCLILLQCSGGDYALKDACYVHGTTHDWVFEDSCCPNRRSLLPKLTVQQTSAECKPFDNINSEIEYFLPDAGESGCLRWQKSSHSEATNYRLPARRRKFSINFPITKPQLPPFLESNLNLLHNSSLHTHKFPPVVNLESIRIPQNLLHNLRKLLIRHAPTSHWNRRQLRTNPNLKSPDGPWIDALAFTL
jgi:hypothetical protein